MCSTYTFTNIFAALDVVGLTPGKEYKFRVSAVNSEGESAPLVADQTVIAKNPFGKKYIQFKPFTEY